MAAEYQLSLNDYIEIIRRRGLVIAASFFGILAVGIVVALVIPPVYRSSGTIMVESQQIPQDLIPSMATSFVEERIEIIRQRVMTRENLLKIIQKYSLFKDDANSLTVSEQLDEMRKLVLIEPIAVQSKNRRQGQGTIAFKLSFDNRSPNVAHHVANELVTLFLDENVKARTSRATETTEFLAQEADKLKAELETLENRLAAYKQENSQALPEHQELRMSMLTRAEAELKEVEREYRSAHEELRFLDLELANAKAGGGVASGKPGQAQDLGSLKAEYARLKSTYADAHPDVRALKRKIDALEAGANKGGAAGESVSLEVARVQAKIAAANTRIESLNSQMKSLRGRIGTTERQIIQAPQVERGMTTLMRDHENARKKYEEIRAKQMNAQIAENLEGENKAERFSLLEPPVLPEKPFKPDRLKILLIGVFAAAGGATGIVMLLEMLNQRIRGQEALSMAIRQRPLAVISYITTSDELQRRSWLFKKALIGAGALIVIVLITVNFAYMSLDILMMKVIARLS